MAVEGPVIKVYSRQAPGRPGSFRMGAENPAVGPVRHVLDTEFNHEPVGVNFFAAWEWAVGEKSVLSMLQTDRMERLLEPPTGKGDRLIIYPDEVTRLRGEKAPRIVVRYGPRQEGIHRATRVEVVTKLLADSQEYVVDDPGGTEYYIDEPGGN